MNTVRNFKAAALLVVMALLLAGLPCTDAEALTYYESDGVSYEEGYIFVGESHIVYTAIHILDESLQPGVIPGLDDVSYNALCDEFNGKYAMKGNLFFVFGGMTAEDDAAIPSIQTRKEYIYSDGKGQHGIGVAKIHEIIDKNPNIAHWNIISYQGAVQARDGKAAAQYYAESYRNWIEKEFPYADVYFLSLSTMTKYYKSVKNPGQFNDVLKSAFPERFLDYTEFYNARYPQGMMDPSLKSDTLHWSFKTYTELIVSVIHEIQLKRETQKQKMLPMAVTDAAAVLYTNDNTVIYSEPSLESAVVLPFCDTGLPIQVTGVTDNGFFRVCVMVDGTQSYIKADGLSQQK